MVPRERNQFKGVKTYPARRAHCLHSQQSGKQTASSAIVALVAFESVNEAIADLDKFEGGVMLHYTLGDEVYQQLSDAVEDW